MRARALIIQRVDCESKYMDSQHLEGIHHNPELSVVIGANGDGAWGQRLKHTMRLLSHERTCQQQFDDNLEGPSVLWTRVLANAHDNVRQLDSERQTVQGMHGVVQRSITALYVCAAGGPRRDLCEARCGTTLSVGVPEIAQVRQQKSGQV